MKPLYPFLIALQFLTRWPVRLPEQPSDRAIGLSLAYYPAVGLLLGALLALLGYGLADAPPLVRAAVLLAGWVALTGALHLDGLADSADAWVGGAGDRARTLTILKDAHSGAMAVTTLVVVLLLKFAALSTLPMHDMSVLVWIPALARSAIPLLFLTTRYVRPGGLGDVLATNARAAVNGGAVALVWLAAILFLGLLGLWLLLVLAITFWLARRAMVQRLGGTTGDTAGALIELGETAVLLGAVLMMPSLVAR